MKSKILRASKSTLSVVLTIMMLISTMAVGMITVDSKTTGVKVYYTPDFTNGNNLKVFYCWKYDSENSQEWSSVVPTDTGKTISGKSVYVATFDLEYDGARSLKFQTYDGDTYKSEVKPFDGIWIQASTFNNKYWNGSSWVEVNFDTTPVDPPDTTTNYYIGGRFGVKSSKTDTNVTWTDTSDINSSYWNASSTAIPFTKGTDGVYRVVTNRTVKELTDSRKNTTAAQFFLIHTGDTTTKEWYGAHESSSTDTKQKIQTYDGTNDNKKYGVNTLSAGTATDEKYLFRFNDSNDTRYVTLCFDPASKKLWCELESTGGSTTDPDPTDPENPDITTDTEITDYALMYGVQKTNFREWDQTAKVYKRSDGSLYAKIDNPILSNNYYFALCGKSGDKYSVDQMFYQNGETVTLEFDGDSGNYLSKGTQGYNGNGSRAYQYFSLSSDKVASVTIELGKAGNNGRPATAQYILKANLAPFNPNADVIFFAMSGTSNNYDENGTQKYGDTTLKGLTGGTEYKDNGENGTTKYSVKRGDLVTIQTQIKSDYIPQGYYVEGYSVNGEYVKAEKSTTDGLYYATYRVNKNFTGDKIFAVPLYLNKQIEEAGDYIRVYVDARSLINDDGVNAWGDILGCYSYYYTGETKTVDNKTEKVAEKGDGSYPGQPLLRDTNGKYWTKVSRYHYSYDATAQKMVRSHKYNSSEDLSISGITINGFKENTDYGCNYKVNDKFVNNQTYDYDDFKYIADLDYDTVQFEIMYEDNTKTNQETLLGAKVTGHPPKDENDTIAQSTYNNVNGWEALTDFRGNYVDPIGTILKDQRIGGEYKNSEAKILIVSTGNQKTDIGTWSTVWYVYGQKENSAEYSYITSGLPSDFIPRPQGQQNTSAYQAYETFCVKNKLDKEKLYTMITYESEMGAASSAINDNTGVRVDGRWYYTNEKTQATVKVLVQYKDENGNWVIDTDNKITNSVATIDNVTEKTFDEINVYGELNVKPGKGYQFVEWFGVEQNNKNTDYKGDKLGLDTPRGKFLVETDYVIYARVEKTPSGQLTIGHELLPTCQGDAYCEISAVRTDKNSIVTTFDLTEGNITIPVAADDQSLKITLKTTCKGLDKFVSYYDDDLKAIDSKELEDKQEVTKEIPIVPSSLFKDGELDKETLTYYSDVAAVRGTATIYYHYYDRFDTMGQGIEGTEKVYIKKDIQLGNDNIDTAKQEYTLKNEAGEKLIYQYAPAIDDLFKNCIWTLKTEGTENKAPEIQGVTAHVYAVQNVRKYDVYQIGTDGLLSKYDTVPYNSLLINGAEQANLKDNDFKLKAEPTSNGKKFQCWNVFKFEEYNEDTTSEKTNAKVVAKCYSEVFTLRILDNYVLVPVYDDAPTATPLISDPKFTREQYTDASGKNYDYLYVDFLVAYANNIENYFNKGGKGENYKTGIIIEISKSHTANNGVYDGEYCQGNADTLAGYVKSETLTSGKQDSYTIDGTDDKHNVFIYEITNNKYNNFNRLDYFVKFANSAAMRDYEMTAYYYVWDGNKENDVQLSTAVYYNLYDIGTSKPVTDQSNATGANA